MNHVRHKLDTPGQMPKPSHIQDDQRSRNFRSLVLSGAAGALFLVLLLRLVQIQVLQAPLNKRLSKENRMQLHVVKAPRGRMFDRHGEHLARNRPSYSISVLPYNVKDRDEIVRKLLNIRDREGGPVFDSTELVSLMRKGARRRFDATRLKEDVGIELVSIIQEHAREFPGIVVQSEARREYPLSEAAFHVLGYMGEIPESDFDSLKEQGYRYGDLIGKAGLEKQYESLARGEDGQEFIEVNAYGQRLGPIPHMPMVPPVPGSDLYLTLDRRLQKVAFEAFPDSLKGSVVMLDPRSGEVLVMTGSPSVDPNIFSLATSRRTKEWAVVATDPALPLNNRAVAGTYTPGSTFKPISALAALEEGEVGPTSRMPRACTGAFRFGNRIAHCWYAKGHGYLPLIDAIKLSCNVYFYQVGLKLGDKRINKYAEMLGLGQRTGIDLPSEKSGWLSGEEAYNKRFARRGWKWTRGLVLDMAIGQTQILTPLQLAMVAGALGNGKAVYRPHLLKEVRSRNGIVIDQTTPEVTHTLAFDSVTVATVRKALRVVVERGGTGWRSAVKGIPVGGKTGSAENPQGEKTHALFMACAPVDKPVVAVAVVVENAGHGGSVAAPIAGKVLRYYFEQTDEGRAVVEEYAEEEQAE